MLPLLIIGNPKGLLELLIESEDYQRREYVRAIKKFLEKSDTAEGSLTRLSLYEQVVQELKIKEN
jgi:hypothetical protein